MALEWIWQGEPLGCKPVKVGLQFKWKKIICHQSLPRPKKCDFVSNFACVKLMALSSGSFTPGINLQCAGDQCLLNVLLGVLRFCASRR